MRNERAKRAKILFFTVKYANLWGSCCRRRRGCLSSLVIVVVVVVGVEVPAAALTGWMGITTFKLS